MPTSSYRKDEDDDGDDIPGSTFGEYADVLDRFQVIAFNGYLRSGMRIDRKGEWIIPIGVPQHYRIDDETKAAIGQLAEWTGFSFQVILTKEKPRVIETTDAE